MEQHSLVVAAEAEPPVIAFLNNTIAALSESQKSVLNSQATNRELMGVVIQDNFNLKEENNQLRARILELERTMARAHQEEEQRREALRRELDGKIMMVQQLATEAMVAANSVEMPDIKTVNNKPGCLGALLGSGTQIVTMPHHRKHDNQEKTAGGQTMSTLSTPATSAYPNHPKPMFPPE